ncbi:DUF6236 family protein [Aliirhizobium cellulosilyticum]|uniref:Uncharacterized protein n=1 Tax=Aliirhizobium cellulosilyticum TaxID=393664 RepID=A0A7W6S7T5_9HYPH|nr:DUF6236 family protein [Rhizobium cellulosilyticum]MBB4348030.1 hypothetical protein [Rhizobium cellulosilyticum]MBB4409576.1 hypothetical protein [Rhizobium cellulosilyticum]MBB4444265.1 hypothetical protein [Rhizobium cellulosilyticum]
MWLLYWDKLANPTQSNFVVGLPREYEFLETAGIFSNHFVDHFGGTGPDVFRETSLELFDRLEEHDISPWAVYGILDPEDKMDVKDGRILRVALMSALPIPNQDVPLDDILTFRDRRSAEREALMAHIDDVYQSVVNAPDRPLAEHTALKRLASGAKDQVDAIHESRIPFRLMDLASDFNLVAGVAAAAGSLAIGATWPVALGNSLVAGGSITIGKIAGIGQKKKNDTPFRYVGLYHDEVFKP